jgi:hypothetical protein
VSEALENAAHVAVEGHGVHAQDGDGHGAHDPMHVEHGCGGGAHVCPCHAPTVALRADLSLAVAAADIITVIALDAGAHRVPAGFRSAPFRPPAS